MKKCPYCAEEIQDGAIKCRYCGSMFEEKGGAIERGASTTGAPRVGRLDETLHDRSTASAPIEFAGFWTRFIANMVDGLIAIGLALIGAAIGAGLGAVSGHAQNGAIAGYYVIALGSFLYFALCESGKRQATFGKRAVGVIVTDTHGQRISFGRATGRFFSKFLNQITLGVGWIMVGVTAQKRGLRDYVAGTVVIKATPASRPAKWVVIAVCGALAVPFAGVVAAIAVPGLLRARMSGNETSAIGSLRAIHSAQVAYHSACGGFAPDLPSLSRPTEYLAADFTTGQTVTKSGYTITLARLSDAAEVSNDLRGCEGAVNAFVAIAAPVTPGSTGTRYFATNTSGTIYQDTNDSFTNPTAVR